MSVAAAVAGITPAAGGSGAAAPPALADDLPRRVVVAVTVDGLAPRALVRLGPARTPAFARLVREGASTYNARTTYESTSTLPNHASMMTGRRVLGEAGHQVDVNRDPGGTLASRAGHYIAGIFDVAHDRSRRTALYTSKGKFRFLRRSWDADHGAPDRVGVNNGRDKLTRFLLEDADVLVSRLISRLRNRPDQLSFLHLALPDAAGHRYGWMSPAYLDSVRQTDALLGRVLRTIAARPALRARTTVVVTADHGGIAGTTSHGDPSRYSDYRVPFLVWGPGVRWGADLYTLNPQRRRPGYRQPWYFAARPIRNIDLARLATSRLALPGVPGGDIMGTEPLRLR